MLRDRLAHALAGRIAARPTLSRLVVEAVFVRDPQRVSDAVGPRLARDAQLDDVPVDVPVDGGLRFEHLAGLFSASPMTFGVAAMTVRELAYLHGLAAATGARTAIEIGRYRGGSTLALASALPSDGRLVSIDIGEKETRLRRGGRGYDDQIRAWIDRYSLPVDLVVGDSATLELDVDDVDIVFIDGDHSYEAAKIDIERWGRRARPGAPVLLHDAAPQPVTRALHEGVERAMNEAIASGEFEHVKTVDSVAHLRRLG